MTKSQQAVGYGVFLKISRYIAMKFIVYPFFVFLLWFIISGNMP